MNRLIKKPALWNTQQKWGNNVSEVDQKVILQAILDLSKQVAGLSEQITETESRLTSRMDKLEQKLDKVNAKMTILSDELLETRADVLMLKKAK